MSRKRKAVLQQPIPSKVSRLERELAEAQGVIAELQFQQQRLSDTYKTLYASTLQALEANIDGFAIRRLEEENRKFRLMLHVLCDRYRDDAEMHLTGENWTTREYTS